MEKKKLGTAYQLFAKAIESDNENVKDALEALLMITALTEGADYHANPFDDMNKQIAKLQHEVNALQARLDYPGNSRDWQETWNPNYGPVDTYKSTGTSINEYKKLKQIQKMMMETPSPTGIQFPKDKP